VTVSISKRTLLHEFSQSVCQLLKLFHVSNITAHHEAMSQCHLTSYGWVSALNDYETTKTSGMK